MQLAFGFSDGLERKFWAYHNQNPHVFELFERFAKEAARLHGHYGAKAIFERVRWHMDVETVDAEEFKLNNNYTSRYARLFMLKNPGFDGFFRTRELLTSSRLERG